MCSLEKLLPVEYKHLISLGKCLQRNLQSQNVVIRIDSIIYEKLFLSVFHFNFRLYCKTFESKR